MTAAAGVSPTLAAAGAVASALWHRGEVVTDSDDYALAIEIVRAVEPLLRAQIVATIESLHSDYDPSGSGDRWHACQDQREHDLLERCEAIARGES